MRNILEEKNERAFQKAVNQAMRDFGDEVRAESERRQDEVAKKIREEMARLRPQAKTLLYGPTGLPPQTPKPIKDPAQALAEAKDERDFQRAVRRALKAFREEVRAESERRKDEVVAKIQEEIAQLRPHAKRLLYGSDHKE